MRRVGSNPLFPYSVNMTSPFTTNSIFAANSTRKEPLSGLFCFPGMQKLTDESNLIQCLHAALRPSGFIGREFISSFCVWQGELEHGAARLIHAGPQPTPVAIDN